MRTMAWTILLIPFAFPCAAAAADESFAGVGAAVEFVTLEAEADGHVTRGTVVKLAGLPRGEDLSPQLEASGRAFVELRHVGDYVEFSRVPACNTIVIRHCIPDAPDGGGITATLGLYVNGQRRQDLSLSSKYNWLYGGGKVGENGQSNTPTDYPHAFWDESRYVIADAVKAGDTLRLQKDAGDEAAYYRIDLIDLEQVGPPLPQPPNSLSVADYGAKGDDADADTAAILRCIADAKAQGKVVWVPSGKYLQNQLFVLDGVVVQGAGMWHTELYDTVGSDATTWAGRGGFKFLGDGAAVSDLYIDSLTTTSRRGNAPKPFQGGGTRWSIRNVWVTHTGVGMWMFGSDAVIANCRVRMTYADAININNGKTTAARDVLIENNHVRGVGDDGIAILCGEASPGITQNVTIRRNTIVANWWAGNISIGGGPGHVIEDNLITDGTSSGLRINTPAAYPKRPLEGAAIRRNVLARCGSNYANQKRGALWVYAAYTTVDATIEDNRIIEPLFRGIHVYGGNVQHVRFARNLIERPGEDAIFIDPKVQGTGVFTDNVVRQVPTGFRALANHAGSAYALTERDTAVH